MSDVMTYDHPTNNPYWINGLLDQHGVANREADGFWQTCGENLILLGSVEQSVGLIPAARKDFYRSRWIPVWVNPARPIA